MDPLAGALLAGMVAWASILVVIRLPIERWIRTDHLRHVGGATLALVSASFFGAQVPPWLPFGFLSGGLAVAAWAGRRDGTTAASGHAHKLDGVE